MKQIILASSSPRRKELLETINLKFKVVPSKYEEDMTLKMKPMALARFLSKGKAEEVASRYKKHLIISADTFVVFGDKVLGKPKSKKESFDTLKKISGKKVSVISGFTIIDSESGKKIVRAVETSVYFKKITEKEIKNYIATGEPADKAGSFAVQGIGAVLIKKTEGNYSGIVGLPLYELAEELKKFGVEVL